MSNALKPSKSKNDDNDFKSFDELISFQKSLYLQGGSFKQFLLKVSKVFSPMIPAFIGAGILSGISGILQSTVADSQTLESWVNALGLMLKILTSVFIIIVGWRIGEEWGGSPGLTALIAAMFCGFAGDVVSLMFIPIMDGETITAYNFLGMIIDKDSIQSNWFTLGFVTPDLSTKEITDDFIFGAPRAGLVGALISVAFAIVIEKQFKKFMPSVANLIVTPILVLLIMIFINILFVIPVGGYILFGIAWLFETLYTNPFGAALLAGIFLFAQSFGIQQGFLPIYVALIAETGINGLYPVICMAGVAQVGVSIAMWIMAERGSILRRQISAAIVPGIFGVGEPLIYGVTLPRVKPIVIASIAGACGGFVMGAISTWGGINIGMSAPIGPGGLIAAIMMTTVDGNVGLGIGVYLSVAFVVYIIGATLCFIGYSRLARNGLHSSKQTFINYFDNFKEDNEFKNRIIIVFKIIGWALIFATIVGLIIFWVYKYNQLTNDEKLSLKDFQLV